MPACGTNRVGMVMADYLSPVAWASVATMLIYCGRNVYYSDVMMCTMTSNITGESIVYSIGWVNNRFAGEFPAQRASNAENASIWWRHRVINSY